MKKIIIFVCSFLLLHCSEESIISEKELLKQKVEAFQFLSKYHSQLHIMIGEERFITAILTQAVEDASYTGTSKKYLKHKRCCFSNK